MFNLFKIKKQEGISITAPCSGRIIPISEVNDPIFSKSTWRRICSCSRR